MHLTSVVVMKPAEKANKTVGLVSTCLAFSVVRLVPMYKGAMFRFGSTLICFAGLYRIAQKP